MFKYFQQIAGISIKLPQILRTKYVASQTH